MRMKKGKESQYLIQLPIIKTSPKIYFWISLSSKTVVALGKLAQKV
jgi:hypothetical protein